MIQLLPALLPDRPRPKRARGGFYRAPRSSSFLLPVEVVVPRTEEQGQSLVDTGDLVPAEALNIARLEGAFSETEIRATSWRPGGEPSLLADFVDADVDRFYIQVRGLPNVAGFAPEVEISTVTGSGIVLDPPTKARLQGVPGSPDLMRSEAQLLVTREDDDEDAAGGQDEEDFADRTHLAHYDKGEDVEVLLKLRLDADSEPVEMRVPLVKPRKATVRVLQMAHPNVRNKTFIEDAIRRATRTFHQVGVHLDVKFAENVSSPAGTIDDAVGVLYLTDPPGGQGPWSFTQVWYDFSKGIDVIHNPAGAASTPPVVNAFFLKSWLFKHHAGQPGLAGMKKDIDSLTEPNPFDGNADEIFKARDTAYLSNIAGPGTLAHELLHIFARASHPDQYLGNGPAPTGNLLLRNSDVKRGYSITHWQTKRIHQFIDDPDQHPNRQWTP